MAGQPNDEAGRSRRAGSSACARRIFVNNDCFGHAGETYEYTEMYPGFSKTAHDEGFVDIAEWLETLARAEKSHAGRFAQGLENVS